MNALETVLCSSFYDRIVSESFCRLSFAPDACKSHDYTADHQGIRCLLLCKVAVGNAKTYYSDQPTLTGPPSGYNSVLGLAGGGVLNYPELVLYNEDAVLPAYVVFYRA